MLTPEQRRAREGRLTASKIGCLMTGDAEKIYRLFLEMTGQEPEEDLSGVWAVQLGTATETVNLDWYERRNGHRVVRRGEVVVHPEHDWAAATLDGWIAELACPIDAKHVQGREPLEVVLERYFPQMTWQMLVTGAGQAAVSVIVGAREPVVEFMARDAAYARELMDRATQFMQHVRDGTPPVYPPAAAPPADYKRSVDMSGNALWQREAGVWLQCEGAAKSADEAAKVLKALVPPDAVKCYGAGVRITRDRAGRMSLRRDNDNGERAA